MASSSGRGRDQPRGRGQGPSITRVLLGSMHIPPTPGRPKRAGGVGMSASIDENPRRNVKEDLYTKAPGLPKTFGAWYFNNSEREKLASLVSTGYSQKTEYLLTMLPDSKKATLRENMLFDDLDKSLEAIKKPLQERLTALENKPQLAQQDYMLVGLNRLQSVKVDVVAQATHMFAPTNNFIDGLYDDLLAEANHERTLRQNAATEHQQAMTTLRSERSAMERQVIELKAELKSAGSAKDALTTENKSLRADGKAASGREEVLRRKVVSLEEDLRHRGDRLIETQTDLVNTKQQLDRYLARNDKITQNFTPKLDLLMKSINSNGPVSTDRQDLTKIVNEMRSLTKAIQDAKEAPFKQMQAERDEANNEIKLLHERVGKLETTERELREARAASERYKTMVDEDKHEKAKLENEAEFQAMEAMRYSAMYDAIAETLEKTQTARDNALKRNHELDLECSQKSMRIEQLDMACDHFEDQSNTYKELLLEATDEKSQQALEYIEEIRALTHRNAGQIETMSARGKTDFNKTTKRIDTLVYETKRITKELKADSSKQQMSDKIGEELKQMLAKCETDLAELRSAVDKSNATADAIHKELGDPLKRRFDSIDTGIAKQNMDMWARMETNATERYISDKAIRSTLEENEKTHNGKIDALIKKSNKDIDTIKEAHAETVMQKDQRIDSLTAKVEDDALSIEMLTETRNQLKLEVAELKLKLDHRDEDFIKDRESNQRLQAQVDNLMKKDSDVKTVLDGVVGSFDRLQVDLKATTAAQGETLTAKFEEKFKDTIAQVATLATTNESLRVNLGHAERDRDDKEENIRRLETQLNLALAQVKPLEEERASLNARLHEATVSVEVAGANATYWQEQADSKQAEHGETTTRYNELWDMYKDYVETSLQFHEQYRILELDKHHAQCEAERWINHCNNTTKDRDATIGELRTRAADLKTQHADQVKALREAHDAEIDEINSQLNEQKERLASDLEEAKAKVTTLSTEGKTLQEQLEEQKTLCTSLLEEKTKMMEQNSASEQQRLLIEQQRDNFEKQCDTARKNVESLGEEITALTEKKDEIEQKRRDLQTTFQDKVEGVKQGFQSGEEALKRLLGVMKDMFYNEQFPENAFELSDPQSHKTIERFGQLLRNFLLHARLWNEYIHLYPEAALKRDQAEELLTRLRGKVGDSQRTCNTLNGNNENLRTALIASHDANEILRRRCTLYQGFHKGI